MVSSVTRFEAEEEKAIYRPSSLTDAKKLGPFPWVPPVETLTRSIDETPASPDVQEPKKSSEKIIEMRMDEVTTRTGRRGLRILAIFVWFFAMLVDRQLGYEHTARDNP